MTSRTTPAARLATLALGDTVKVWARGCWARVVTVDAITDSGVTLSDRDDEDGFELCLVAGDNGAVLWNGSYSVTRIAAA